MKVKITLALAAVALTTAVQMAVAAERAKLPTAMLGHWCGETDDLALLWQIYFRLGTAERSSAVRASLQRSSD